MSREEKIKALWLEYEFVRKWLYDKKELYIEIKRTNL